MQREPQTYGSQKQHPTSKTGAEHVSAAFTGGEQQGTVICSCSKSFCVSSKRNLNRKPSVPQRLGVGGNIRLCPSQGKDEVYDRMLLDYFLSYHKFIHLLCRVAINCEKFTDTLVKLSTCLYFHCYHYSILIKPHEFAQKHRCFHVNALPPSQVC